MSDSPEFSRRLIEKYQMRVPEDIVESIYTTQPKLPVLLSRASFRPDTIRSSPEIRRQQERRNLLRNVLGVIALSVPVIMWVKVAFFSPQAQIPTYVTSGQSGRRLLTSATNIPVNQSLTFNDPTYGPFILIHLDSDQFVAYSAICTHLGCTVSWVQQQGSPAASYTECFCHNSIFDPARGAKVRGGPAPIPLAQIGVKTTGDGRLVFTSDFTGPIGPQV